MKMKQFSMILLALLSLSAFGAEGVAKAILLKGSVQFDLDGKTVSLKKGDWVKEGAIVKTSKSSFVKFLFIDKSQMNLGPNSEMKIKTFPQNEAGIIDLIKGKVRAKVTKNYMEIDKKKSKLFIKTKNAAMGVRGTDFQVIYNESDNRTGLITFEGAVAMTAISGSADGMNQERMDDALRSSRTVLVRQGEYSGTTSSQNEVSMPVKISPSQLEVLKKNDLTKSSNRQESSGSSTKKRNMVPAGMSSKMLATKAVSMEKEMKNMMGEAKVLQLDSRINNDSMEKDYARFGMDSPPEQGSLPEMRAGGFVDINTGQYIQPSTDAVYNKEAGIFIIGQEDGSFDKVTGDVILAEGKDVDEKGEIITAIPVENSREIASIDSGENQKTQTTEESDDSTMVDSEIIEDFREDTLSEFENAPPPIRVEGTTRTKFDLSIQ